MKVTMVEASPGESLDKCKANGGTSAGVLDLKCCSLSCHQLSLQRNTGRALIKVSALVTLPGAILDQVLNISLDLLMIPGCYWSSLCLWRKASCNSRHWQEWAGLEKWRYCLVKQERWTTAWSFLAVLWGRFGMGSSNTCFAVLFHWCPLSSTWGDGGCVPVVH